MKHKPSRRAGFSLVEIMIVAAILGLLAAIAVPNFMRARMTAHKNVCINNLRIIADAIQQLQLERPFEDSTDPDNIRPYFGRGDGGVMPVCPIGGEYDFSTPVPTCTMQEAGFEHRMPR